MSMSIDKDKLKLIIDNLKKIKEEKRIESTNLQSKNMFDFGSGQVTGTYNTLKFVIEMFENELEL